MTIEKGEIYGFLGPNGAGKTTLMKILTNLVRPTRGTIELFGEPVQPSSFLYLRRIGSMIEYPIFYEKKTAKENLIIHCDYMGLNDRRAIGETLELVDLEASADAPVHTFSLGMKQRLGIARAILTKPELLILDEPINGLDPAGIKKVIQLFRFLSREHGTTLLISSHMLHEIEQLADTLGVIKDGRMIEEVSMSKIRGKDTAYVELVTPSPKKACVVLDRELKLTCTMASDDTIRMNAASYSQNDITKVLIAHDIEIESISKKNKSLEEHFFSLLQQNNKQNSWKGDANDQNNAVGN